ncbi:MAG: OmpH family outer membrane protein [Janthinobacterium lividum]
MTLTRIAHNRQAAKWPVLGAAALALISFASAQPVAAAPTPSTIPVIGSVDISKLQQQSARKTKYDTDLHALADRLDVTFKLQAASIMLSSADQNELGALLNSPRQSDSDRARITALETKAAQAAQQLVDLQQKKDPTPTDTAQLGALNDANTAGQKIVQGIGDGYQAQLKKLSDDDNAAFTQSVKEAIAAAAKEHGLSVVFTSDIAVYTTNDITDDVIKRLNK